MALSDMTSSIRANLSVWVGFSTFIKTEGLNLNLNPNLGLTHCPIGVPNSLPVHSRATQTPIRSEYPTAPILS